MNQVKIIFMGERSVGKTSMIQAFMDAESTKGKMIKATQYV